MSTYLHKSEDESESFDLTERHIYGSSRLGMHREPVSMLAVGGTGEFHYDIPGYRNYELSNHLGNVTTVLTGQKVPVVTGGDLTGYVPQILSSFDYSPFGVTRVSHEKGYLSEETENTNPLAADFRWCMDASGAEANGSGYDAVLSGVSNTPNRTAEANKALRTSGSSGSFMEIADNADLDFGASDFTVSIWVRKAAAPTATVNVIAAGKWLNTGNTTSNEWCLNIASPAGTVRPAQFQIAIGGTLYTAEGSTTLPNNQWYHLVGVREGTDIKFYLNGALVQTTPVGTGAVNNVGRKLRVGCSEGALRTQASFDEFAIYHRALSASEISDLYAATCEDLEGTPGGGEIAGGGYRYGFNGMEKDDEVKGSGNSYDFGARIYDSRLGRWLSLDPLQIKYPGMSPYNYVGNSPIKFVEYDGKDFGVTIDHSGKTILITATFYTISENTHNEALGAASSWNNLSGSTIQIGGETYTVSISVEAKMAEGSNSKERFANAHSASASDIIGNTYNGSTNGFKSSKNFGKREGRAMKGKEPIEAGLSDGKNITMPLFNRGPNVAPYYGPRDKENSIEHEMGHSFGLDDPGGAYYTSGGVMDYEGPFSPNMDDVGNMLKYALDGGGGIANVKLHHQTNKDSQDDYKELKSTDVGK